MTTESISQRVNISNIDAMSSRQIAALLTVILSDVAALRAWASTHQHSALNAAPTTTPPTLNTLP